MPTVHSPDPRAEVAHPYRSRAALVSKLRARSAFVVAAASLASCLVAAPAFAAPATSKSASSSAATPALTVNVPPAVTGQSYTQPIGFESFNPTSEMMTATSGLPAGVTLSPTGVLSAAVSPAAGSYTIQADISPAPAAASNGVIDIALTVVPAGSATAKMVQGTASPAAPSLAPLIAPTLGGRIACSGYSGCNTSTSTFGGDAIGHPMTQWTETGQNFNGSCNYSNFPVWMTNNSGGADMGVFIDDSIDANHSFTNREALIACAYNLGQQVIVVGMGSDETGQVLDMPNGEQAGQELIWYPYCNGQPTTGTGGMPTLSQMSSLGYTVQQNYVPGGCNSGATAAEHQTEWNAAWNQVNGTYDYTINSLGRQIWSPWGDLLASY